MEIVQYPEELDPEKKGILDRFAEKHRRRYGKFLSHFEEICRRLKEDSTFFEVLEKNGYVKNLGGELWEFRIPPAGKGGVLRVYFLFSRVTREKIVILDLEIKKESEANLERARERLKIYRKWEEER
jgi:hypothetical protein